MRYSVEWTDEALSTLASLWLLAPNRPAITAAQAKIDLMLENDAIGSGSLLSEGLYAMDFFPLRALYEVNGSFVEVVAVKMIPG